MTEAHFRLHGIYSSRVGPCSASLSTPLPRSTRPPNVRLKPNMTGNGLMHAKKIKNKTKQTNKKITIFRTYYFKELIYAAAVGKESRSKIQAWTGFELVTAVMPVQCSNNRVIKPTGKLIILRAKVYYINPGWIEWKIWELSMTDFNKSFLYIQIIHPCSIANIDCFMYSLTHATLLSLFFLLAVIISP